MKNLMEAVIFERQQRNIHSTMQAKVKQFNNLDLYERMKLGNAHKHYKGGYRYLSDGDKVTIINNKS
jgi:hypothetical protein